MSSAPAFIYSEAKIAEALDISRTELRSYRARLSEGDDWKKERGEILLSNKGLERLSELCGHAKIDALVQSRLSAKKKRRSEKNARGSDHGKSEDGQRADR